MILANANFSIFQMATLTIMMALKLIIFLSIKSNVDYKFENWCGVIMRHWIYSAVNLR